MVSLLLLFLFASRINWTSNSKEAPLIFSKFQITYFGLQWVKQESYYSYTLRSHQNPYFRLKFLHIWIFTYILRIKGFIHWTFRLDLALSHDSTLQKIKTFFSIWNSQKKNSSFEFRMQDNFGSWNRQHKRMVCDALNQRVSESRWFNVHSEGARATSRRRSKEETRFHTERLSTLDLCKNELNGEFTGNVHFHCIDWFRNKTEIR